MSSSVKGVCSPSSDPLEMLISRVVEHEGIKKYVYSDTRGFATIGIGRCVDSRVSKGLSIDECFYLLRNDLAECRKDLSKYAWFNGLEEVRQGAMVELAFNLGMQGLLQFKNMIDALTRHSFQEAAKELVSSLWAKQVQKSRVDDLVWRISNGRYK